MKSSVLAVFLSFLVSAYCALEWSEPEKICVGAKGDNPGYWKMQDDGVLRAVKLKHDDVNFLTCDKGRAQAKSKWGCNGHNKEKFVNIHITDNFDNNVFPIRGSPRWVYPYNGHPLRDRGMMNGGYYAMLGRDNNSPSLGFSALYQENALKVKDGDEIKIWFGEDLFDDTERDNDGMTCMFAQAYIAKE